jgi:hypothetical protein
MACLLSCGVVPLVVAQPNRKMPNSKAHNPTLQILMILSLSINDKKLSVFLMASIINGTDQTYYRQSKLNPLVLNKPNI